jgi:sulfatase maturation enzyme AslB (radical SAM superfamily)
MKFDISKVKILHLEPTSRCNAACPQCARYQADGFTLNPAIEIRDLTLSKLTEKLGNDFISQLDKMFMCGTYGDPAASNQALVIYDWFRHINPQITLGMNTNGSLRSLNWWSLLGQRLNRLEDYCVFSIDGLEDTNHIYRRNTIWHKIMQNAKSFIDGGGRAHWDMLVFKHNEHQVDECMQLAKDMGFAAFRAKVSKRFASRPVAGLEPPQTYTPVFKTTNAISCHALADRSIYMNYLGELMPCCWLAASNYSINDFDNIITSWDNNPVKQCISSCSTVDNTTNFDKQWVREVYFK